jgi:hypothetical protein
VHFGIPGEPLLVGQGSDISVTGLSFKTESPRPVGSALELDLRLNGAEEHCVRMQASVRRVNDGYVGVQFAALAETEREKIEHFIHTEAQALATNISRRAKLRTAAAG